MFDSHCHLTFKEFDGRVAAVLAEARAAGVRGAITISTTTANAMECAALAEKHESLWCSAGVHPLYADQPRDWNQIRQAARHPRCVAFGELGLDNHYERPARAQQHAALEEQLEILQSLAAEGITKPIIVHCRKSFDDLLPIFRRAPFEPSRYVFHCFTGGHDDARHVLDFGAWISFTGVVTFKNARDVAEAAKLVPADRIMVETDAPYLPPEPVRKLWPNEPQHVAHIGRFLAALRGVDAAALEAQLDANAERFFGIKLR